MKVSKRQYPAVLTAIAAILVAAASTYLVWSYKEEAKNKKLQYCREYDLGDAWCKGNVNVSEFERKDQAFAIGANSYGYAVFKKPEEAFRTLKEKYALGISVIQKEFKLATLSQANYEEYETLGWQVNTDSKEEREQALFVTQFFDIYSSSFNEPFE